MFTSRRTTLRRAAPAQPRPEHHVGRSSAARFVVSVPGSHDSPHGASHVHMNCDPRFATARTPRADLGRALAGASWSTPVAGAKAAVVRSATMVGAQRGVERIPANRDRSRSHEGQSRIAQLPLYGQRDTKTGAGFEHRWPTS